MGIARPKRKRRRVDVSLRLDEARAGVEALDDMLDLVDMNGWVDEGQTTSEWVAALKRLRHKLQTGLDYVAQTEGDR